MRVGLRVRGSEGGKEEGREGGREGENKHKRRKESGKTESSVSRQPRSSPTSFAFFSDCLL